MDEIFPEYSATAKAEIDLFLQQSADVIFYFEDEHHEAVYERLVHRLFPSTLSIFVICPGGKTKVIEKAKSKLEREDIITIYVVDKDFDDLLGNIQDIPNLYYLNAFSIENHLLQLDALLKICVEEDPISLGLAQAKAHTHDWDRFIELLFAANLRLTRLFVVAQRFRVGISTTKTDCRDLLTDADDYWPHPTEDWISRFKSNLVANCLGVNEWLNDSNALDAQLELALVDENGNVSKLAISENDHQCGKHLFGCAIRYIRSRLSLDLSKLDPISFYVRLMGHVDLASLYDLRSRILRDHPHLSGV